MRTLGILVVTGLMVGCGAAASPASPARSVEASGGASGFVAAAPAAYPSMATTPAPGAPPPAMDAAPPAPPSMAPKAAPGAAGAPQAIAPMTPPVTLPRSGQVTAGVWDDNRNFDFWKPYQSHFAADHGSDFAMFTTRELDDAHLVAERTQGARTELDVQLVLDTTGSMGDELSYLQSEFLSIAKQVNAKFPNVQPRWSLVVYRDHGDDYVTRPFPFTTAPDRFKSNLSAQSAGGGGDIPEAVVEGLGAGVKEQWRTQSNVAKLIFWVADAPAHPGEGPKLASVLRDAQRKGIHIYPVASSDADDSAEYQMRSAAQLTGGRYVFLTNDSGIGSSHAEPHIPCYDVAKLDKTIVRMIEVEMSGKFVPLEKTDIIRAVGAPDVAGKCKLASGMLVASY